MITAITKIPTETQKTHLESVKTQAEITKMPTEILKTTRRGGKNA